MPESKPSRKRPRRVSLTAQFAASVKVPDRDRIAYWDSKFPRFGLRVTANGVRTWVVTYRFDGRPRWLTLGHYPALAPGEARDLASKRLADVANGIDPGVSKAARRQAESFKDLSDLYIERHASKKRTGGEDGRVIAKDLLPAWGGRKAREIRRADVIQVLDRIKDRGAPIMANRTRSLISKIFSFGLGRDLVDANPCAGVEKPVKKETPRDRVLSPAELRTLWRELDTLPEKVAAAFKLALATAQRRGEVLGMRWAELDLEAGAWTIPAERSKNGMSHRVFLAPIALDLLRRRRAVVAPECPFVLPGGRADLPLRNLQKYEAQLRKVVAFRYHDLRRTAATEMGRLGITRETIGAVLNHAQKSTTAIYDRATRDDEKRRALLRWDRRLSAIVAGEEGGQVVELAR
ncbi:MAG: tyrosine-type recombinase/integrase [Deltaproteobacteria bacterium]|nr:tyrosine-type recombinase/integrase [Deltaproteobacteria bacterium]